MYFSLSQGVHEIERKSFMVISFGIIRLVNSYCRCRYKKKIVKIVELLTIGNFCIVITSEIYMYNENNYHNY